MSHKKWHDSLFLFRIKIARFFFFWKAHLWTDQNGNQNSRLNCEKIALDLRYTTYIEIHINIWEHKHAHTSTEEFQVGFSFGSFRYLVWFDLHKGGHKTRIFIWPTLISCAMGERMRARLLKPMRLQMLGANKNIIWLNKLQCFAAEQIKD